MRLRRFVAALIATAVATAAVAAEGPVPEPPAARSFRLGALELTALRSGGWEIPNDGSVLGTDAGAAGKLLAAAGAPTDKVTMSVDALLVRLPGRLVLLDAGLGPSDRGVLPASLALAGVKPAQITDVLITHAHLDHTGGLLDAAGKPAYPNAVIRLSAREWASMRGSDETKALAAAIAARVKTFEPGQEVLPGVVAVALYGHTPGHTGYVITSNGRTLEDIGDLAHSSVVGLARPDWRDGYDAYPAAGVATRVAELKRLAASHVLVFSPHFAFPGVGRIEDKAGRYVWKPS